MRQQRKVIRPGLLVTVIIGSILMAVYPLTVFSKEANILVEWGSDEGMLRLSRSKAKVDFFPLANNFESQTNKVYCGVASSTIVLNALRVRNTETKKFLPKAESVLDKEDLKYISGRFSPYFDRYTQNNVLNNQTKSKLEILGKPIEVDGSLKRDVGLQLDQVKQLLQTHKLKVEKYVVTHTGDLSLLRRNLKKNLTSKNDFVIINYSRKGLDQTGGGHISPVGAYDEESDSVLVMDVNSNKANWVWVTLKDLVAAMATYDTVENRGYLLVSEK